MSDKSIPSQLPYTEGKWHLPFPSGQYPVLGYQDIMTGKSRTDGVFLRLIYPAANQTMVETHSEWPKWFPHPKYKSGLLGTLPSVLRPIVRFVQYFSGELHIPICHGAKLLERNKKFPVIIFSHGLSSNRTTYSSICNQLASYGFIVAAVEHRDESAYATVYPSEDQDGLEWLPYRRMSTFGEYDGEAHFNGRQEQLRLRISEIRATCELIRNLNAGNSIDNNFQEENAQELDYAQFKDKIDMENVIAAGHSYGAATVIFSLEQEPLLKMGICLDAWMYSLRDFDASSIQHPLLFINMDNFQSDVSLIKMRQFLPWEGGSEERKVLKIKDSRHPDVSDLQMLLLTYPGWMTSTMNWFVPLLSKVNPFALHQAMVSLCLDFINKHGTTSVVKSHEFPPEVEFVEGITLKNG